MKYTSYIYPVFMQPEKNLTICRADGFLMSMKKHQNK
jgi:hypothetical protein